MAVNLVSDEIRLLSLAPPRERTATTEVRPSRLESVTVKRLMDGNVKKVRGTNDEAQKLLKSGDF